MDSGEAWTGQGYPPSEPPKTESGGRERWAWRPSAAALPAGSAFVSQHCSVRACSVTELCLTLCNPVDCSPLGSSVHGILQARMLEWVSMPSSRGSSWPRDGTRVSCVSCTGRWVLYCCTTWRWPLISSTSPFPLLAPFSAFFLVIVNMTVLLSSDDSVFPYLHPVPNSQGDF